MKLSDLRRFVTKLRRRMARVAELFFCYNQNLASWVQSASAVSNFTVEQQVRPGMGAYTGAARRRNSCEKDFRLRRERDRGCRDTLTSNDKRYTNKTTMVGGKIEIKVVHKNPGASRQEDKSRARRRLEYERRYITDV